MVSGAPRTDPTGAYDCAGVDAFVRRLRGTFDQIYPRYWQIDWQNIPSPFRWYEGPTRIDLPPVPRRVADGGPEEAAELVAAGGLGWVGALLQASYGVTGVRWYPEGIAKSSPEEPAPIHRDPHYQLRRPVPSGGVTYPAECYLAVGPGIDGLTPGTYHYDAVRHALAPLALGPSVPGLRIVLTVPLWKNYFKYGDFSYRLGTLDTGAVVGQFALTARRWGWACRVSFGNDERLLLSRLGLDASLEAAPVVLDIDPHGIAPSPPSALPPAVPPVRWRGAMTQPPPDTGTRRMHGACLDAARPGRLIDLPPVPVDGLAPCAERLRGAVERPTSVADAWARTALGDQYRASPVYGDDLAGWLAQVHAPLDCDVPGAAGGVTHPRCLLLARSVTGLSPGAYLPLGDGRLTRLADGDHGELVQRSLFGSYMNFAQAPLIAVLVGSADPHRGASGAVGYRTQHLLAGVLAQRLAVAATRDGYSAHPVLGFVTGALDDAFGLTPRGLTSLLLVGVGRFRRGLYLENSLHPAAVAARNGASR